MGATAPDSVKRLVDHFDQDHKVFLSPDYKEEQLRAEFLNPFFESLGWDVANRAGLTEVVTLVAGGRRLAALCGQPSVQRQHLDLHPSESHLVLVLS